MKKTIMTIILCTLLALTTFTGCGQTPAESSAASADPAEPQASKIEGTITYYTSMPEKNATKLIELFTSKYPGTSIELYRAATGTVLSKLQAEMQVNQVVADVVAVAEPDASFILKKQGALHSFTPKGAEKLDAAYKDKDGCFYSFNTTCMAMIYNTQKLTTVPTSYKDMLDPRFKGKVSIGDAGSSGAVAHMVGTIANSELGWDYFSKLKENGVVIVKGPSEVASKVATGEAVLGISQDVTILDMKESGSPVDIVYPSEGVIVKNYNIQILKSSKNIPLAEAWVEFLLSPETQQFILDNKIGNPVIKDVKYAEGSVKVGDIPAMENADTYIAENGNMIKEKFAELFN